LRPLTSDLRSLISHLPSPTSYLRPPPSDLRPPLPSALRPLTPDFPLRPLPPRPQPLHPHVPEFIHQPFLSVMLECDIAVLIFVILKIHRLHAVEPDLDVRPLGPDAICVPLAGLEGAARLLVPLALERHQPAAAALVVET